MFFAFVGKLTKGKKILLVILQRAKYLKPYSFKWGFVKFKWLCASLESGKQILLYKKGRCSPYEMGDML